jgi:hypothetical protein
VFRFQVETWASALPDMRPLFDLLWAEVALDKDKFRSECNEETYANMEKLNMLHIVTARTDGGQLAGYHVSFVTPHMHYKNVGPMAFTDMYFLLPRYRVGGLGAKLLCFLEKSLRERGVIKAYLSHKIAHDHGRLFELLGWRASDVVYSKYLGAE